jgi:hypothetical protein
MESNLDLEYVIEYDGKYISGDERTDDYVYYLVNDEVVKVPVDKEYLRWKLCSLEKVIYQLVEKLEREDEE